MGRKKNFDRALAGTILMLAWPTIIEQALQTVVMYVDSAMVGRISAEASAAVGITATVGWLLNAIFFAAGVGCLACISRAVGAGDERTAKVASVQSVILTLILGVSVGLVAMAVSGPLPGWLGAEPDIQKDASAYFFIAFLPMLFRAAVIIFGSVLRATGDMRTPMLVNAGMNGINIVLNYLFIYETRPVSLFGFSFTAWGAGLGVAGAAIATAISFVIGGVVMTLALWRSQRGVSPAGERIRIDRPIMATCVRIGLPNAMERATVNLGQIVFTMLVARLGTIAVAAHTIALTAEEAFFVPALGFQAAATTLSGQTLGEGNERKLDDLIHLAVKIIVAISTVTGLLLFIFPNVMMALFTIDPQVIAQGTSVLRIVSVSEPFLGATFVLEGVFNGVGDTKAPFVIATLTTWGIRILFTHICVNFLGMGLNAVWVCMVADVIVKCIVMFWRYRSGGYKRGLVFERPLCREEARA